MRWRRLKQVLLGAPRNPLAAETRRHMALVAFLAWIGLGADGLSSANYGPEEAFIALGNNTHLALYLAVMTALTVFIIGFAYNQVIELFPSGGGGYKVATVLIGRRAGLVSGAALIVDYVLTIAISIASGIDALFSLLPVGWQAFKLPGDMVVTLFLLLLNLRGMKEPLKLLLPLFLGFLLGNGAMIVIGIALHAGRLPGLVPATFADSARLVHQIGWVAAASLLLRAFAMGGGTYTGIEAVSNNVNMLKEPRVATGRWTMLYMASSLAFTAAGLIVLYLLWRVVPQAGRTLNAVTYAAILHQILGPPGPVSAAIMLVLLTLAACLLFVGANTGFLGGPAVLANMAADRWVPYQFSQLSNRLVTQNGVLLMGLAAVLILLMTGGRVGLLVVLYSINVFITFSLCLCGLCRYWWQRRSSHQRAGRKLALAALGALVSIGVLLSTLIEKFAEGAWMTLVITGLVIGLCLLVNRHYRRTQKQLAKADALFATATPPAPIDHPPALDPEAPTAVFIVGRNLGTGMHSLLAARRLFGNQYRNYIFLTVGEVDAESYRGEEMLAELTRTVEQDLALYLNYCHHRGIAATSYHAFGADPIEQIDLLAEQVIRRFPKCVFFATTLLFNPDNLLTRLLHNQTALDVQRRLHLRGVTLVVLPMQV